MKKTVSLKKLAIWLVLLVTLITILFPIYWVAITSFKSLEQISTYPPKLLLTSPTLSNYQQVIMETEMPSYFLNSALISAATIILTLLVAVPGGYAAARFEFFGKTFILFLLLSTLMIPGIVILIPLYILGAQAKLLDTYLILIIVYSAWRTPIILWMMKSFFEGIPRNFEDSALVDGCTPFQAFYKVILPSTKPALASSVILLFVFIWNEFIIALTLSSRLPVITVGLHEFMTGWEVEWGKLMAVAMCALLPVLIIFFLFQRGFIRGLTSGAIKG